MNSSTKPKKKFEMFSKSRKDLSKYAPRIITTTINVDKIKDVIGPGGKMINKIITASIMIINYISFML